MSYDARNNFIKETIDASVQAFEEAGRVDSWATVVASPNRVQRSDAQVAT